MGRYCSYLLPRQTGATTQILVFKTLRMIDRPALYRGNCTEEEIEFICQSKERAVELFMQNYSNFGGLYMRRGAEVEFQKYRCPLNSRWSQPPPSSVSSRDFDFPIAHPRMHAAGMPNSFFKVPLLWRASAPGIMIMAFNIQQQLCYDRSRERQR